VCGEKSKAWRHDADKPQLLSSPLPPEQNRNTVIGAKTAVEGRSEAGSRVLVVKPPHGVIMAPQLGGRREAEMTEFPPNGMSVLSPHLVIDGASAAIDFYKEAFGAEEMARMPGPDGRLMHGSVRICGASVMLVDENPAWGLLSPKALGGSPVTIHLYVPDVDAFVARAVAAGATVTMPVDDQFWGDRYGVIKDPFGHSWSIATQVRTVTLEEAMAAMQAMGSGTHA
jgi:PhnB protein